MKVICDNCGAMYKIPDEKLVKPVNKATCRQCGHRMLIPRPRRGADPDERTLVTAVPPTPPPAPSRGDTGPPTTPIHEVEEKTAPTGGRRTEETRWVRNELPASRERSSARELSSDSGRAKVQIGGGAATERVPAHASAAQRPQENAQRRPRNAFDTDDDVATQVGPDPTLTYTPRDDVEGQVGAVPGPGIDDGDEDADAVEATPEPPRRARSKKGRKDKKAAPAHDPRGDMGLALFGVMVALAGIAILGTVSVIDASWSYGVVLGGSVLGTMLAVGGGVGAFLVLLTSGRGRKPAWRVASVILAVLAALVIGGIPAGARVTLDALNTGVDSLESQLGQLLAGLAPPAGTDPGQDLPEEPPADPAADEGDGLAMVDGAEDTDAAAEDTDAALDGAVDTNGGGPDDEGTADDGGSRATTSGSGSTSGRSTSERSTSGRSTSGRTSSGRSSGTSSGRTTAPSGGSDTTDFTEDEELTLPDDLSDLGVGDPEPAASNLPVSPPLTAIDVMVKSNTGVKRCFFDYQQAEGSLPKRVDVKFTIKPDGDATSIGVTQNKLQGSELESCLIRSIRSITFPPSQKGTTLTFPFVFG